MADSNYDSDEDNMDIEIDGENVADSDIDIGADIPVKNGKKRGRKSAAEREEQEKNKEADAVNDFDFENRDTLVVDPNVSKITCGKCLFYSRKQTYGVPCDKRGIVGADIPCSRFQYNVLRVQRKNIPALTEALANISKSGISISELLALMTNAHPQAVKNLGFTINQRVWFSTAALTERQTVDTWHSAVIIGTKNGYLLLALDTGDQLSLLPNMLLTEEEFEKVEMKVAPKRREALEQIHGLKMKLRTIDDAVELFGGEEKEEKPVSTPRKIGTKAPVPKTLLRPSKGPKKTLRLRG